MLKACRESARFRDAYSATSRASTPANFGISPDLKPVCLMVGSAAGAIGYRELGASAFIAASAQAFLRQAVSKVLKGFRDDPGTTGNSRAD